jgi:hypothetical protein
MVMLFLQSLMTLTQVMVGPCLYSFMPFAAEAESGHRIVGYVFNLETPFKDENKMWNWTWIGLHSGNYKQGKRSGSKSEWNVGWIEH